MDKFLQVEPPTTPIALAAAAHFDAVIFHDPTDLCEPNPRIFCLTCGEPLRSLLLAPPLPRTLRGAFL